MPGVLYTLFHCIHTISLWSRCRDEYYVDEEPEVQRTKVSSHRCSDTRLSLFDLTTSSAGPYVLNWLFIRLFLIVKFWKLARKLTHKRQFEDRSSFCLIALRSPWNQLIDFRGWFCVRTYSEINSAREWSLNSKWSSHLASLLLEILTVPNRCWYFWTPSEVFQNCSFVDACLND